MLTTQRWERVCTLAGAMALLAFAIVAFSPAVTPLSRWMASSPDAGAADAAVVLGAAVDPDGQLHAGSLRRALAGIVLQRQGRVPLILMLGPCNGTACEAEVRARLASDLGVPRTAILTETRGLTTALEAERAAEILIPRGLRTIALVSGEQHLWRAQRLFERAGFEVLTVPVQEDSPCSRAPQDRLATAAHLGKELTARVLYRVMGRL